MDSPFQKMYKKWYCSYNILLVADCIKYKLIVLINFTKFCVNMNLGRVRFINVLAFFNTVFIVL